MRATGLARPAVVAGGGVGSASTKTATPRLSRAGGAEALETLRAALEQVTDPEIPVLTIADLGVLREVSQQGERVQVVITPTYSGCPAMEVIAQDIKEVLRQHGCAAAEVKTQLFPPWTTDWLSAAGKEKLRRYGIAPPLGPAAAGEAVAAPRCPRCDSGNAERVSEFGSTPCKALYRCGDCREPFDYFKCL